MRLVKNLDPICFEAWQGGVDTIERVKKENKVDEFNALCEEVFANRQDADAVDFNDFLWFEQDFIFESLGIEEE